MTVLLPILITLFFRFEPTQGPSQTTSENTVWGTIAMPSSGKNISRGNLYNKDGSPVVHSKDEMANSDRNVIVSLVPLDFKPILSPTRGAFITQKEQTFLPLVLPVTIGTEVNFVNEDQYLHSIQSLNRNMKPVVQKPPGENHPRKMKKPGIIKLGCDIHGHMRGYIWVLNTPYFARVDEKGKYRITQVPDGNYQLEVFHPDRNRIFKRKITVKGGITQQEDVDLARA